MELLIIMMIAISLSMDAFSLSLAYGTNSISKKEINMLSFIVGFYHFFMPIIGMLFGMFIVDTLNIKEELIVLLIFVFIGINMIIESLKKEEIIKKIRVKEMLLFGLAVSIDSFSVGMGINSITNNFIISSLVFSIVSFVFTYLGLFLGNKINQIIGRISTIIGGFVLIFIGIIYFLN